MPLTRCSSGDKPGWKWGDSGVCYTHEKGDTESEGKAKAKAYRQGAAAGELGKSEQAELAMALNEHGIEKGSGPHTLEYLRAVLEKARKHLPDDVWKELHAAALPLSGAYGRWRPRPDVSKADQQTGSMLALYPDADTAQQLAVDGGEAPDDLHCTVIYLGQAADMDLSQLADLVAGVRECCDSAAPLDGEIGGHGTFYGSDTTDGQDVWWAHPDLPGLFDLRTGLMDAVRKAGVQPPMDHGYTPHMTLAYRPSAMKGEPDSGDFADGPDWYTRPIRPPGLKADGADQGMMTGTPPRLPLRFDSVTLMHGGQRLDFPLGGGIGAGEDGPTPGTDSQDGYWKAEVELAKADAEQRIVYGVVLAPDQLDSQGDWCSPADIEKAAHGFMAGYTSGKSSFTAPVNVQHGPDVQVVPVESYVAPADMIWTGPDGRERTVKAGSWVMAAHVPGDELWSMVQNGRLTGWSIEGSGLRTPGGVGVGSTAA